jgi:ribosome-associated protein
MEELPDQFLQVNHSIRIPMSVLEFRFDRSGGPGGQNVNKVNTQATLRVNVADLEPYLPQHARARLRRVGKKYLAQEQDRFVISAAGSRSQLENRLECLEKLRGVLRESLHRPKPRVATKPSRGARERRLQEKKERGQIKRRRQSRPSRED